MVLDLCPWYKNIVKVIVNRAMIVISPKTRSRSFEAPRKWSRAAARPSTTKMIENGADSHHGIALSFLNHLEVDQILPDRVHPHAWVPCSTKKLQLCLISFPNHRARRHGASESEVLTLVSVYKRRGGVTKKNVRGWWNKSS